MKKFAAIFVSFMLLICCNVSAEREYKTYQNFETSDMFSLGKIGSYETDDDKVHNRALKLKPYIEAAQGDDYYVSHEIGGLEGHTSFVISFDFMAKQTDCFYKVIVRDNRADVDWRNGFGLICSLTWDEYGNIVADKLTREAVKTADTYSGQTTAVKYEAGRWYSADFVIDAADRTVKYYIDGELLCEVTPHSDATLIPDKIHFGTKDKAGNMDCLQYGNNYPETDGTEAFYVDNFGISYPDEGTYTAVRTADELSDNSGFAVDFSQTLNAESIASIRENAVVYSPSGENITQKCSINICGGHMYVNLPDKAEKAEEYCVRLPYGIKSITGKALKGSEIYYITQDTDEENNISVISARTVTDEGNEINPILGKVPPGIQYIKLKLNRGFATVCLNGLNTRLTDGNAFIDMTYAGYDDKEKCITFELREELLPGTEYNLIIDSIASQSGVLEAYSGRIYVSGLNSSTVKSEQRPVRSILNRDGKIIVTAQTAAESRTSLAVVRGGDTLANAVSNAVYFNQQTADENGCVTYTIDIGNNYGTYNVYFYDGETDATTQYFYNYVPADNIFTVSAEAEPLIFNGQQAVKLFGSSPCGFTVDMVVYDSKTDTKVYEKSFNVVPDINGNVNAELVLDMREGTKTYGNFYGQIKVNDPKLGHTGSCDFDFSSAKTAEYGIGNSNIGFSNHLSLMYPNGDGMAEPIEKQKRMGSNVVREDFYRYQYQKGGKYELSNEQKIFFAEMQKWEMTPYLVLTSGVSFWDNPIKTTTEQLESWADYVKNAVRDTKQYTKYYEVLNEPNLNADFTPEKYAQMLKYAYEAVMDENVTICAPAAGYTDYDTFMLWLDRLFAAGAGNYMDAISYHRYGTSPEKNEIEKVNAGIKALLSQYGLPDMPIIISEFGWAATQEESSLMKQAKYAPRAMAITAAYADMAVWYGQIDIADNIGDEAKWGVMTRGELLPKPAYLTMSCYNSMTAERTLVESKEENGIYSYTYEGNDDSRVQMLWRADGEKTDYNAAGVIAYDMYGNEIEGTDIKISDCPIYLFTPGRGHIYIKNADGRCIGKVINAGDSDRLMIEFINEQNLPDNYELVAATYKSGRLVNVKKQSASENALIEIDIGDADAVKAFLWEKGMMLPVLEARKAD